MYNAHQNVHLNIIHIIVFNYTSESFKVVKFKNSEKLYTINIKQFIH